MFETLVLAVMALTAVVSTLAMRRRVNTVSLFSLTWLPLVTVLCVPGLSEPGTRFEALILVGSALFGVIGGAAVGSLAGRSSAEGDLDSSSWQQVDESRLVKTHKILVGVLAAYAVLQLVRALPIASALGGWQAIFISAGNDFRRAQLLSSAESSELAFSGSSALLGILNYLLFIGHVSIFTGAILWVRRRYTLSLIPLILAALYGVAGLQRSAFFMALALFLFGVIFSRRLSDPGSSMSSGQGEQRKEARSWLRNIAIVVLAATILLAPLQIRNAGTENSTGLESITQYYWSGVLGLNARLTGNPSWIPPASSSSGDRGSYPGYGAYTFSNVFSILGRAGVPVATAPAFYDYYKVRLFGSDYLTNTGTSALDFRYDFGPAGPFLMFFFLSSVGTAVETRFSRSYDPRLIPVLCFVFVSIAWSFFGNSLLNDVRYLIVTALSSLLIGKLFAPIVSYGVKRNRLKIRENDGK